MTGDIASFGPIMFGKSGSKEKIKEIISKLDLKSPIIIKPNWSTSIIFTEKEILDWILTAIDGDILVVESYAHYRSPLFRDHEGPLNTEIMKKLASQKKENHKTNEPWFLELSGIGKILRKHEVEYLNLSEEVWANRVCESDRIRELVETRFSPLHSDILYSLVPTRLYELRGGTLISLTKPKIAHGTIGVSMAIKNLFGMIPPPERGKFHGENDSKLNHSIVDISKICHSLFNVRGIVEAVFSTTVAEEHLLDATIHRNLGLIWGSNDALQLDAFVAAQLGFNPDDIGHLALASRELGPWDSQIVKMGSENPIDLDA
ncbi:MAG: DUF362 domain-containing protein [Candidatus Thorarchaeota archaeon]